MKFEVIKKKAGNFLTGDAGILAVFSLLALGAGTAFTLVAKLEAVEAVKEIKKPEAGTEAVQEQLRIECDGEFADSYTVEVPARLYEIREAKALLEKARADLDRQILGENTSAEYVTENLWLPTGAAEGKIVVDWSTDRPEYLHYDGTLEETIPREGVPVWLEARMTCQEEELYYRKQLVLYPAEKGQKAWLRQVRQALDEENQDGTAAVYRLPRNIGGKKVVWSRERDNPAPVLALTILAVGFLIVWQRRERDKREVEQKREGLFRDYPAFVSRMCLFLGAGLSVRQVFYRMAKESRGERNTCKAEKVREGSRDYLTEEMRLTCRELEQGISEAQAYCHLGERSGLLEYRTFSALLVQNIRKGNQELLAMLQGEAEKAFADRRRTASLLGSKAGTKLLMPMGLMLVVVLLLVLYPACVSFYG